MKMTRINKSVKVFQIVFRARNIHTPSDIIAIDDIEYNKDSTKALASLVCFVLINLFFECSYQY